MKFLITFILVATVSCGYAQSNILKFTDYTMAQPLINPAAMGLESGLNGLVLYRSCFDETWPSIGALNVNGLIPNKDLGGGISIVFDKHGPYQKMMFYLAGTYRLKIDDSRWLYFGLQLGLNYVMINADDYNFDVFENLVTENYSQPNFGIGMHYKAENYFLGLSIPEFRHNTVGEFGERVSETMSEMMRIYLYGGMQFKLGKESELMPYTYVVHCESEDLVIDLGVRLTFKEIFQFGVQYRTKESFAVMSRVKLTKNIWLGYSFENSSSNLGNPQEIGLTFRFGKDEKKSSSAGESYDDIRSIRYF